MLAELRPPMTTMTSERPASSRAACWRSLVASQMVFTTQTSGTRAMSSLATASRVALAWVVCTTTPTRFERVTPSSAATLATATAPGAWPRIASTSGCPASPTTSTW